MLFTAVSDSEDFGPALADDLPPSGQEAQPSMAYSKLVDVLLSATEKLSIDWPDEPRESQSSNSMSGSLAAQIQCLNGGSYRFSAICIMRSPDTVNSLSPPALLTRQPLISPT